MVGGSERRERRAARGVARRRLGCCEKGVLDEGMEAESGKGWGGGSGVAGSGEVEAVLGEGWWRLRQDGVQGEGRANECRQGWLGHGFVDPALIPAPQRGCGLCAPL